jgi:hypothetical protein
MCDDLQMSTKSLLLLFTFSLMLMVVACSNGYTDEEVQATVESAVISSPQKAFLEITNIFEVTSGNAISCSSRDLESPCGGVTWLDGRGEYQVGRYAIDSTCYAEVKIGYDLPDSCR